MSADVQLAVVIPYYKATFFEPLLQALVAQTDQRFRVYVGDDCSAVSPQPLLDRYVDALHVTYRRFDVRMGHENLTGQWMRCVGMIGQEQWVWVLPDDDLPSPDCVQEFYQALARPDAHSFKLIRIPLVVIDGKGAVTHQSKEQNRIKEGVEDNLTYYTKIVRGQTSSSLGDNIFHRQSFENRGGFVCFPKAWGSDHATAIAVAAGGLIYTLNNARLMFRMSGENISSNRSDGGEKIKARILFAKWLKSNEGLFPCPPEQSFYQYFYWKGEHYAMEEWAFDWAVWWGLYKLRTICLNSKNPIPLLGLVFRYGLRQRLSWMKRA